MLVGGTFDRADMAGPGEERAMEVVVDLTTKEISVRDSQDLGRFSVRAVLPPGRGGPHGDLGAVAEVLAAHGAGRPDPSGDLLVDPAAVRAMAHEGSSGAAPDAGWDAGFASMLDHAASKGWVSEDGWIRAHVEWDH
jgi:hypothetical protein